MVEVPPLPDVEARRTIREDLARNVVVRAGAGTGKTTCLVGRLLEALRTGVPVERIAAITFTEKAAGELRERLRTEIERAAGAEPHPRWEEALRALDRAHVSTIHAFAGSILREFPLEAGFDPGARVADEVESGYLLRAAWNAYLRREAGEVDEAWLRILEGADLNAVWGLAHWLAWNRDILAEGPEIGDPSAHLGWLWDRLVPKARELADLARSCTGKRDAVGSRARFVSEVLREAGGDPERLVEALRREGRKIPNKNGAGTAAAWGGDEERLGRARLLAKECLEVLGRFRDHPEDAARHEATRLLLAKMDGLIETYAEEKRSAGALDYQDLLIGARDLLRDRPAVRRELAERFRHVLVDEFQDTDPLQAEIVLYLCDRDGTGADWRDVRLEPGKLLLVGDPKQSIYGWRRADVETCRAVTRLVLDQGGVEVVLDANFRSAGELVGVVNGFFAAHMIEEENHQPAYGPIHRSRSGEDPPSPLLHLVGVTASALGQAKINKEDADPVEAATLAGLVEAAVGSLRVVPKGEGERSAEFRDIAVLARKNESIRLLESAMQARGLPYVVVGGRGYFQREEVADLVLLLRCLTDPHDRLSLAGALRSPVFGLTDADLHRLARAQRLDYLAGASGVEGPEDLAGRAELAFEDLRRWHAQARRTTAPALVETLLAETPLVAAAVAGRDGEQRFANLRKFLEIAQAYTPPEDPTASGFLSFLDTLGGDLPDEGESPLEEEGGDAVRLLTIHKAKGLEFPVVFLANLHASGVGRNHDPVLVRDPRVGRPVLGVDAPPWLTLAHRSGLGEREARRREAEAVRLLYVAMTRARDHLFLSGAFTSSSRSGDSPFSMLCEYLGVEEKDFEETGARAGPLGGTPTQRDGVGLVLHRARPSEPEPRGGRRGVEEVALSPLPDPDPLAEARVAATVRLQEVEAAAEHPPEVTATWLDRARLFGIAGVDAAGREEEDREDLDTIPVPRGRGGRAARIGTAVHHVLAGTAPGDETGWEERLGTWLSAQHDLFPEESNEVASKCRALLAPLFRSGFWGDLGRARRSWREVPLAARLDDGTVVRGRADLVVEREDGRIEVVDWKTDRLDGREPEEAAADHAAQARAYSLALERATGRPVSRFVFAYLAEDACRPTVWPSPGGGG